MTRTLRAEERRLWAKVAAAVNPLHERVEAVPSEDAAAPASALVRVAAPSPAAPTPRASGAGETLDSSWDRRLSRGLAQPDRTVDLHGHSLNSAYVLLDHRLEEAIAAGARVILLVTGKPRRSDEAGRGAIRAAVGDWLASSRHAGHIAAVRPAHPRHGGSGALYIILRRAARGHMKKS